MVEFFEDYFDLYNIFVNQIVGDVWLTIILALLALFVIGIKKYKMPLEPLVLMAMLVLVAFFSETFIIIIWAFVGLSVAAFFYWVISRVLEA